MAGAKLSRRKIAAYCADELLAGRNVIKQLAAYLTETHRENEMDLIVRDIEAALAERGLVVADLHSSRKLGDDTKNAIASFLAQTMNAERVVMRESVDDSLLGGVRVSAAGRELDTTLRRRLNQLKASKI